MAAMALPVAVGYAAPKIPEAPLPDEGFWITRYPVRGGLVSYYRGDRVWQIARFYTQVGDYVLHRAPGLMELLKAQAQRVTEAELLHVHPQMVVDLNSRELESFLECAQNAAHELEVRYTVTNA